MSIQYEITYTNGSQLLKHFESEQACKAWLFDEGDHVSQVREAPDPDRDRRRWESLLSCIEAQRYGYWLDADEIAEYERLLPIYGDKK